ncbi:MAG: polysaccharide biosynthesis tyrosine autokinase [Acidobacteria bacterium]|nr:polysaccharide biosynthesis tyrosine autokinase [Acidobacteriota bacterium]MBI3658206.1 polysaccharide biosynthesis tyrosine autokinase [Acidobacteriota bacterium]
MAEDNNKLIRIESPRAPEKAAPRPVEPLPVEMDELGESVHVRDYWRVLVKHRWIVLTCLLIFVTVAAIGSFKAVPIYKAYAKLEIEAEKSNILPYKTVVELETQMVNQDQYLQTQFKILQSRTLARRVIETLKLKAGDAPLSWDDDPLANAEQLMTYWFAREGAREDADTESRLITRFLKKLEVTPVRNSRLVEVSYLSPDAPMAARIVNTLGNEYILLNFESKYDATQKATEFLSKQLVDLKIKVERSEEDLVKYAQAHDILGLDEKQNVTVRTLGDLNDALTKARTDRLRRESLYRIVKDTASSSFPEVIKTPLIVELEKLSAELRQRYVKLSSSFKAGWPELDQVINQMAAINEQLQKERVRSLSSIEVDYSAALRHETMLRTAFENQKVEANRLNQNAIQYNILKREVDTNKQLYDGLLQRMKEASISAGLKSSNIRIVDQAEVPRYPDRPRKGLNILLSLALGLSLGIGLAFFKEYMDNSIKTPDDVDRWVRLPNLGVIPSIRSIYDRKRLIGYGYGQHSRALQKGDGPPAIGTIAHTDSTSIIAEAYRSVRTALLLSHSEKPPKTILLTSANPSEGKTTSAINLAISLSQLGGRVLLVDCDMRNPHCHSILSLPNKQGMSSFLAANIEVSSLIIETAITNLFVIPAGKIPPNPAELLASSRMRQMLQLVDEFFEFIVIDSPPVLAVTDALILSRVVDGVVLVVRAETTPKLMVQRVKRSLQTAGAKILGVLINQANVRSADYTYYYKSYYSYRYGEAASEGRDHVT